MKLYSTLLMLLAAQTLSAAEIRQKEHEQWWEKNAGKPEELKKIGWGAWRTFDEWRTDWQTSSDAQSRLTMATYIKQCGYTSMLDVPCGPCADYWVHKHIGNNINYVGADITKRIVEYDVAQGLNVIQASIENLPFPDSCVDVAYARHIVEHLDYYRKAIEELIRVAKREALVVFFIKPSTDLDSINKEDCLGSPLYHNRYNKFTLEGFVRTHPKVRSINWQEINATECALHIYMR